jgi:hypothetical protein
MTRPAWTTIDELGIAHSGTSVPETSRNPT